MTDKDVARQIAENPDPARDLTVKRAKRQFLVASPASQDRPEDQARAPRGWHGQPGYTNPARDGWRGGHEKANYSRESLRLSVRGASNTSAPVGQLG